MKAGENDGLLDGIDDEARAGVPALLIASILLLEAAVLVAAALMRFGLL